MFSIPESEDEKSTHDFSTKTGNENGDMQEQNYVWTYEFGDPTKPILVMLHSFACSGMVFYRLFKDLNEHYHVYLIDMLG